MDNEYHAYCFDSAIYEWGTYVEAEMDKAKGKTENQIKGRRMAIFRRLMRGDMVQKFADPADRLKRG